MDRPSEIYNLGAQSHVKVSFEMAEYTVRLFYVGNLPMPMGNREMWMA